MSGTSDVFLLAENIINGMLAVGGINDAKNKSELISALGQAISYFAHMWSCTYGGRLDFNHIPPSWNAPVVKALHGVRPSARPLI